MLGDVLESPLDQRRYRGRDGQMGALRLEAVLVGDVRELVDVALVVGKTEAARGLQGLLIGALMGELALLLRVDAVTGLVAVAVRAVGVGTVQRLLEDRNDLGRVGGGGRHRYHEGQQNDHLEQGASNR